MDDVVTRAGLVAVVGAPNAGKSTLVNALVGQKVAIVTPKAQTTRTRLMGIAIAGEAQVLLVDTPGIFEPKRRLDRAMVAAVWEGAQDADLIALVIDAAKGINRGIEDIVMRLKDRREAKILVLNKVDIAKKDELLALAAAMNQRIDCTDIFMVSPPPAMALRTSRRPWRRGCRKGRGCSRGPGIRRHRPHAGGRGHARAALRAAACGAPLCERSRDREI
jgi:GTP-binding protein Era